MRWRRFALLSLGVNLALAAGLFLSTRASRSNSTAPSGGGVVLSTQDKTNTVVRRQFFSWHELESADYPTYIANLRDIGCPEQTIRDIIIAEVNTLFSRRRALEIVTPEQQWWRSEPDPSVVQAADDKARTLEDERRALLTRLLGTNWEGGDLASLPRPSRPGIVLDGPILGALPTETKQAIEEATLRSQDRLTAYFESLRREGKDIDPRELVKFRQQTRDDLARILSPGQLEEYLLRYSENANELRSRLGQLEFFNATPDEFRQIFRATDYLDQQLEAITGTDANSLAQHKSLEDQRENAMKTALGPKRYEEYRNLQDPLYREAVATAEEAGTPEAAQTIYQIKLAAAQQENQIASDASLTPEQKNIALKQLEVDQLKATTLANGQEPPPEPPTATPSPPQRVHVVGPGDSLATMALMYGVPTRDIQAANPNLDFSKLRPGDALNLPPTAMRPTPPPPFPIR
jgi:LysM repeat protein